MIEQGLMSGVIEPQNNTPALLSYLGRLESASGRRFEDRIGSGVRVSDSL